MQLGFVFYGPLHATIQTIQITLQSHRQIATAIGLTFSAAFRNPERFDLDRTLGCRTFYWITNTCMMFCMCCILFETENVLGVLTCKWANIWVGDEDRPYYWQTKWAVGYAALTSQP